MRGSVTVYMAAPADRVWDLVSDVTRVGEFSSETFEAEWLGPATAPAVGARFRSPANAGSRHGGKRAAHIAGELGHPDLEPANLSASIPATCTRRRRNRRRPSGLAAKLQSTTVGRGVICDRLAAHVI